MGLYRTYVWYPSTLLYHRATASQKRGTTHLQVHMFSTQTRNLSVLEMALPFPAMAPLPEVGNPISRTALTVRFLYILAWAHVKSRKSRVALRKTLPPEYLCMVLYHNARSEKHHFWLSAVRKALQLSPFECCSIQTKIKRRTVLKMGASTGNGNAHT